jgi:hypothetical protein
MDQSGQVGTRKISEAPVCLDSANQPRTDTLSPASHTLPPPSVFGAARNVPTGKIRTR